MSQITSCNLQLVELLTKRGVKAGDLVAVISSSSLAICRLLYAALHLGVTLFPLDPCMARERRNSLLTQAGVDLVLAEKDLPDLSQGGGSVRFAPCAEKDKALGSSAARSELQLIVATSGSEGEPKGVMLSGGNVAASIAASDSRIGLRPGDLWLNSLPMFHIGGIMILYRCHDAGADMLLHQEFDESRVWSDLNDHPVTHISLVPAMLARLLDVSDDAAPPESMRVALIGGGHLSPELAARAHAAGWPLCVSYGMSETCSQCVTHCGEKAGLIPGHVGLPLDGFEAALSDSGRIKVRGPAVMQGYVSPERSPGQGLSENGWFETGDLGEMDVSGCLRVLGRVDDMLVSGGVTIHPVEVEGLMSSCPGVDEVAISSRPDIVWGDLLVALYIGTASRDELEAWCRINLSSSQRPREFIRVSWLPRNTMGKLDRKGLKTLAV
jgi:O-succinylbenzoic acid--CoA ligase